ncbi:MAG: Pycsar system effector family protein [Chitinophagaceae bacterium]
MNHLPIVTEARDYVAGYLQEHANNKIVFHTLHHTEAVVEIAKQMCAYYELGNQDASIALVAAWFVNVGYYEAYREHEESSAGLAEAFMKSAGVGDELIKEIKACLLATKMPLVPATLPQQIVCDAMLFHLAMPDFAEQNKWLRKEVSSLQPIPIDKNEWRASTIQFMEGHNYFTDYCKKHLAKKKKENLELMRKKQIAGALAIDPVTAILQKGPDPATINANGEKEEKKKDDRPERTIETMFRITSDKSQRLSDQSDTKSNIMISVNVIIISVLLTVLLPKLGDKEQFRIPVVMLLLVSLSTIIFSIIATRPRIPRGTFTHEELETKKTNLLFFGNFYKMKFEEYEEGMFQIMDDRHFLYLTLLRDIYTQGVRLGQKYRMLTLAYNTFMYGLVISIIAFVIAGIWPHSI